MNHLKAYFFFVILFSICACGKSSSENDSNGYAIGDCVRCVRDLSQSFGCDEEDVIEACIVGFRDGTGVSILKVTTLCDGVTGDAGERTEDFESFIEWNQERDGGECTRFKN